MVHDPLPPKSMETKIVENYFATKITSNASQIPMSAKPTFPVMNKNDFSLNKSICGRTVHHLLEEGHPLSEKQ